MLRALGALVIVLALVATAEAEPKRPSAPRPANPSVRVELSERGQLTDLRLEGTHLSVSTTAGARRFERELGEDERVRLVAAARGAVAAQDHRWECGKEEVYLTVTVDDKTAQSALCPTLTGSSLQPWRELLAAVRAIAEPRRNGSWNR